MAEPGSINNSGSFLNPLYSSGSQESLSDSVNASETGISPGGRRTRAKTQGHPASQALAERVRSGSYVPGAESPPLRRHRVTSPTTRTPASPNSDLHTSRLASATTAVAPVQVTISVATIRESFGGLIERTAGGAQTVSAGYDSTIRAHFDNIREHVASNSFHGDKAAVTEYLDYLESLLPPRSHDDKQPSLDKLPNGKTVSADNQARWRSDFAKPVASLKTEWAIIAGQIGSLQNASNKQEAIDKIKGQLAHIELRLSAFNQSEDSAEIAQAIQDLSAYQQYLYSELDKKVTAIDAWEKAVGNEVVAAFKIANDAIVSLPGKPEERREALEQIRLSLAALPVAQQEPKTHKFLQAQLRFFEREATVIDVWKASDGHTDRTRTKSNFLQARVFLRQNTYAYADRIDARNQHILAIVEKFPALDPAERHRASNEIRSLLALNESDYDSALASIPDSTGLKKKHVRRVFGDFYNQQAQLSKAAKQAATAPIAPARFTTQTPLAT